MENGSFLESVPMAFVFALFVGKRVRTMSGDPTIRKAALALIFAGAVLSTDLMMEENLLTKRVGNATGKGG